MKRLELLKNLGIFLIGLGIFLLGVLGILIYLKAEKYEYFREPFSSWCVDGYIKIKAYEDLKNVKVLYKNKTICEWSFIRKYTSKVCDVTDYVKQNKTVFIIKTNKGEDVVKCYKTLEVGIIS